MNGLTSTEIAGIERLQKNQQISIDSARDSTKQFLGLATGIVALTITFSKDFLYNVDSLTRIFALLAWASLLLSVFCGLVTLLALTGISGQIQSASGEGYRRGSFHHEIDHLLSLSNAIMRGNVRLPALSQILFFFIGLALTVLFGVRSSSRHELEPASPAFVVAVQEILVSRTDSAVRARGFFLSPEAAAFVNELAKTAAERIAKTPERKAVDINKSSDALLRIASASMEKHGTVRARRSAPADSTRVVQVYETPTGETLYDTTRIAPSVEVTRLSLQSSFLGLCPIWPFC